MKRVLLITGPGGDAQGWGDMKVTESVRDALTSSEASAEIAYVENQDEFLRRIERRDFDIAWSALYFVSERSDVIGASGEGTMWVADELDARGIPYIGPSSLTMKQLIEKHETHRILAENGVRVPVNHVVAIGEVPPEVSFPAFVKPDTESRSVGISDRSVVHDRKELEAQVAYVHQTLAQAALVEEYLPRHPAFCPFISPIHTEHVEVGGSDADLSGDSFPLSPLMAIDATSDVHAHIVTLGYLLSTSSDFLLVASSGKTPSMANENPRWIQQVHFREVALEHMKANGLSEDAFAEILGYSGGTLHQYMYNSEKRPDAFDFLVPFCKETGRSITEFIDDPSASGANEIDRFMSRVMGSDLSKLNENQKQSAFETWRAMMRGYEQHK